MHTYIQRRAYPDLHQGPADLQSAALNTEQYTHVVSKINLGSLRQTARGRPLETQK